MLSGDLAVAIETKKGNFTKFRNLGRENRKKVRELIKNVDNFVQQAEMFSA